MSTFFGYHQVKDIKFFLLSFVFLRKLKQNGYFRRQRTIGLEHANRGIRFHARGNNLKTPPEMDKTHPEKYYNHAIT